MPCHLQVGEGLNEKTSPFDTYAQIIDGSAIIDIDGNQPGSTPAMVYLYRAHKQSHIRPNGRFN
jgi:hypothetical protein